MRNERKLFLRKKKNNLFRALEQKLSKINF